jgi:hypothetical protein
MAGTIKGKAWKKRVSNPAYSEGWDRIFGKIQSPCEECPNRWMVSIGCICDVRINFDLANKEGNNDELSIRE